MDNQQSRAQSNFTKRLFELQTTNTMRADNLLTIAKVLAVDEKRRYATIERNNGASIETNVLYTTQPTHRHDPEATHQHEPADTPHSHPTGQPDNIPAHSHEPALSPTPIPVKLKEGDTVLVAKVGGYTRSVSVIIGKIETTKEEEEDN